MPSIQEAKKRLAEAEAALRAANDAAPKTIKVFLRIEKIYRHVTPGEDGDIPGRAQDEKAVTDAGWKIVDSDSFDEEE